MSPLDFSPNLKRSHVVNIDNFISMDSVVILSKAPQKILKPFILLQIFSLEVKYILYTLLISV